MADRYWNARGGSHTDGGAFIFTVARGQRPQGRLACADKFGRRGRRAPTATTVTLRPAGAAVDAPAAPSERRRSRPGAGGATAASCSADSRTERSPSWRAGTACAGSARRRALASARRPQASRPRIELLTLLLDRRYRLRRQAPQRRPADPRRGARPAASTRARSFGEPDRRAFRRGSTGHSRDRLAAAADRARSCSSSTPSGFPPEGDDCDCRLLSRAYQLGWRRFIVYGLRGQRFHGCGLGPGHRRRAHRRSTAVPATTWLAASTAWRSTSTATPRTSSARS